MTTKPKTKMTRADSGTQFKVGHKGYPREKNPAWKGAKAGYYAIHQWLRYHFGRPEKCDNPTCVYPRVNKFREVTLKPKSFQWALKHGKTYAHLRENFIQLCASCHKKYDSERTDGVRKPLPRTSSKTPKR